MIGTVFSGGVHGLSAFVVKVECDISEGFPAFDLVGLLSSEVKEAKERTVTALRNCEVSIPAKKITVNISPANIRKHGTGFDLPIAVSLLVAMGKVNCDELKNTLIIGELMLSGEVNAVKGVLPIVRKAREYGITRCIVPKDNALEGAVIEDVSVVAVESLKELIAYLSGEIIIEPEKTYDGWGSENKGEATYDFKDVSGQKVAKRGIEIAASGLHNVLMMGPPGTGKTLLAKCIPSILPPMTKEESLEISSIYSVAGLLHEGQRIVTKRPVVEAHHTASEVAMAGGSNVPKPGLISLAHRGVLFLDEMPEFSKSVLEVLRQPLEDKVIHVAKNGYSISYPANFMLVGALNPCPCGMYPDLKRCTCTETARRRYMSKLSKPLIDRMDLCLNVLRPSSDEMLSNVKEEPSETVRKRVIRAQKIQKERFTGTNIIFNSEMGIKEIEKYCELGNTEKTLMEKAISKYDLSARAYHRILRCARTIADLDNSERIKENHLIEALFFKSEILK